MKPEKHKSSEHQDRVKLTIQAIASLYTGLLTPQTQEVIEAARESIQVDEMALIYGLEELNDRELEQVLLSHIASENRDPKEIQIRSLLYAKGVLVGMKKTEDRETRLRLVSTRLVALDPTAKPYIPFQQPSAVIK